MAVLKRPHEIALEFRRKTLTFLAGCTSLSQPLDVGVGYATSQSSVGVVCYSSFECVRTEFRGRARSSFQTVQRLRDCCARNDRKHSKTQPNNRHRRISERDRSRSRE